MLHKFKLTFKKVILDESGIFAGFGAILFSFNFIVACLSLFFTPINKQIFIYKVCGMLCLVTSIIFLTSFIMLIVKIIKEDRMLTYEDLKNEPKYVSLLSLYDSELLLIMSIENNDFDLAILLRDHIKRINENISIN